MAKRVIGDAVNTDRETLEKIFLDSLRTVESLAPGTISVNPDAKTTELERIAQVKGFTVHTDVFLDKRDCIIEAGGVIVDGRLETMMKNLEKNMGKYLK